MKKKFALALASLLLAACFALFACSTGGKVSLLSVTISGAKNLTLPESGAVTLQLTAEPKGSGLPTRPRTVWSVEKAGADTTDATVSASGLFSSATPGTYTVKAAVTVEKRTKTGQASITVSPYNPGNPGNPGNPDDPTPPGATFTGVTVSGAKALFLPESGSVSLKLSAAATGTGLPTSIDFIWSVEKGSDGISGASISENGLFSASAAGSYTVKASATVAGISQTGQAAITVYAPLDVPDDLPGLIALVETSIKEIDSVKKSVATAYALREAKKTSAGETQKQALTEAYAKAVIGYDGSDYSVIYHAGIQWAYTYVHSQWAWAKFPMTVAFSNIDGSIADVVFALPDNPIWQNGNNNNTGVTQDGSGEYYYKWIQSTTQYPYTYLDYMYHFVGMDAKAASEIKRYAGGNNSEPKGSFYSGSPQFLSGATETAMNVAGTIVECAKMFIASDAGKKFA